MTLVADISGAGGTVALVTSDSRTRVFTGLLLEWFGAHLAAGFLTQTAGFDGLNCVPQQLIRTFVTGDRVAFHRAVVVATRQ